MKKVQIVALFPFSTVATYSFHLPSTQVTFNTEKFYKISGEKYVDEKIVRQLSRNSESVSVHSFNR